MSDLTEDLDRALRAVVPGEPPVAEAMRRGAAMRGRRRLALLAGAVAVAAAAFGYPALAGRQAAPAPRPVQHQVPPHHDPVVTAGIVGAEGPDGMVSANGVVAEGRIGDGTWQVRFGSGPAPGVSCYSATVWSHGSGAGTDVGDGCGPPQPPGTEPASFQAVGDGTAEATIGSVAGDVTYFVLTFSDGQQLKLIPASWHGTRYVAWVAPQSMTISGITAHLGGPYSDSGLRATAIPVSQPGAPPVFGMWNRARGSF